MFRAALTFSVLAALLPVARVLSQVPDSVQVTFKEWAVATPEAFPHDPLAMADGAIWYTGQRASLLGRIDPKTGAIREFRTQTPNSGPHGLAADAESEVRCVRLPLDIDVVEHALIVSVA